MWLNGGVRNTSMPSEYRCRTNNSTSLPACGPIHQFRLQNIVVGQVGAGDEPFLAVDPVAAVHGPPRWRSITTSEPDSASVIA